MHPHHDKREFKALSGSPGPTMTTQALAASGGHHAHIAHYSGRKNDEGMLMLETEYHEALQACLDGRFTEELRILYQMPSRARVPWELFPNWARPIDPVEGGHEGGSI